MLVNHMSKSTVGSQPGFWTPQKCGHLIFGSQPSLLLLRKKLVVFKNKGFHLSYAKSSSTEFAANVWMWVTSLLLPHSH